MNMKETTPVAHTKAKDILIGGGFKSLGGSLYVRVGLSPTIKSGMSSGYIPALSSSGVVCSFPESDTVMPTEITTTTD